jgi:hypothetical protein
MQSAPELAASWIHLAYSVRRATGGSVQAAYDALLPAADKFQDEPVIPYNLGCYSCQLGKLVEAREWIAKAFSIGDSKQLKLKALEESDLEPLWIDIAEI